MKATLGGCIALALVFSSVPPGSPDDGFSPDKVISEDDARIISARLYSVILIRACRNGWRYPLSHVKSGFRRHFAEFKLQLISDGYTIVPNRAVHGGRNQRRASAVIANDRIAPRFGCARQYWLGERR
ncbi:MULTISPECIES: hypothetical protein [unclassified Rhizobium]|uniref:hypothetical protein n=1 Tax=unclassified Rhizobium TaxID=2613769 RepID=UPI000AA4A22C|nr:MULTISPECIES: hypothetical protein [unclassified Rhizobium]